MAVFSENFQLCLGFLFLLARGSLGEDYKICQEWSLFQSRVNLSMDMSEMAGYSGSCSCWIYLHWPSGLRLTLNDLKSPGCATNLETSDNHYTFQCRRDTVTVEDGFKIFLYPREIFLTVSTNETSQGPMTGLIELSSLFKFTIQCFEPKLMSPISTTWSTKSTTAAAQSSSTSGSTSSTTVTPEPLMSPQNDYVIRVAVGSAVGGVVLIVLIVLAIVCWRRERLSRKSNKEKTKNVDVKMSLGATFLSLPQKKTLSTINTDNTNYGERADDNLSRENVPYRSSDEDTYESMQQGNTLSTVNTDNTNQGERADNLSRENELHKSSDDDTDITHGNTLSEIEYYYLPASSVTTSL